MFVRNFGIAFGLRAGISVALRAFQLLKSDPQSLRSLDSLLGEGKLHFRVEGVRWGLFFGWLTGGYSLTHWACRKLLGLSNNWNTAIAGFISGLGAMAHSKEQRRTFALYGLARVVQCVYNELKRQGWFTPLVHGDSLLFATSSAHIMYAYVMRPETLPTSYWNFIVRMGPIHRTILNGAKEFSRGRAVDLPAINKVVVSCGATAMTSPTTQFGCDLLHPNSPCRTTVPLTLYNTFSKVWPLYATLTFVPMTFLKLFKVSLRSSGSRSISSSSSTIFTKIDVNLTL